MGVGGVRVRGWGVGVEGKGGGAATMKERKNDIRVRAWVGGR